MNKNMALKSVALLNKDKLGDIFEEVAIRADAASKLIYVYSYTTSKDQRQKRNTPSSDITSKSVSGQIKHKKGQTVDLVEEGKMISKDEAKLLMTNYGNSGAYLGKNNIEGVLFGKNHIENILSQPGCVGIRVYYGKVDGHSADTSQLIIVGTDNEGNDMGAKMDLKFRTGDNKGDRTDVYVEENTNAFSKHNERWAVLLEGQLKPINKVFITKEDALMYARNLKRQGKGKRVVVVD